MRNMSVLFAEPMPVHDKDALALELPDRHPRFKPCGQNEI